MCKYPLKWISIQDCAWIATLLDIIYKKEEGGHNYFFLKIEVFFLYIIYIFFILVGAQKFRGVGDAILSKSKKKVTWHPLLVPATWITAEGALLGLHFCVWVVQVKWRSGEAVTNFTIYELLLVECCPIHSCPASL